MLNIKKTLYLMVILSCLFTLNEIVASSTILNSPVKTSKCKSGSGVISTIIGWPQRIAMGNIIDGYNPTYIDNLQSTNQSYDIIFKYADGDAWTYSNYPSMIPYDVMNALEYSNQLCNKQKTKSNSKACRTGMVIYTAAGSDAYSTMWTGLQNFNDLALNLVYLAITSYFTNNGYGSSMVVYPNIGNQYFFLLNPDMLAHIVQNWSTKNAQKPMVQNTTLEIKKAVAFVDYFLNTYSISFKYVSKTVYWPLPVKKTYTSYTGGIIGGIDKLYSDTAAPASNRSATLTGLLGSKATITKPIVREGFYKLFSDALTEFNTKYPDASSYPLPEGITFTDNLYGFFLANNYIVNKYAPDIPFGWDVGAYLINSGGPTGGGITAFSNTSGVGDLITQTIDEWYKNIPLTSNANAAADFVYFDLAAYNPLVVESITSKTVNSKTVDNKCSPGISGDKVQYLFNSVGYKNWINFMGQITKLYKVPGMLFQVSAGVMPRNTDDMSGDTKTAYEMIASITASSTYKGAAGTFAPSGTYDTWINWGSAQSIGPNPEDPNGVSTKSYYSYWNTLPNYLFGFDDMTDLPDVVSNYTKTPISGYSSLGAFLNEDAEWGTEHMSDLEDANIIAILWGCTNSSIPGVSTMYPVKQPDIVNTLINQYIANPNSSSYILDGIGSSSDPGNSSSSGKGSNTGSSPGGGSGTNTEGGQQVISGGGGSNSGSPGSGADSSSGKTSDSIISSASFSGANSWNQKINFTLSQSESISEDNPIYIEGTNGNPVAPIKLQLSNGSTVALNINKKADDNTTCYSLYPSSAQSLSAGTHIVYISPSAKTYAPTLFTIGDNSWITFSKGGSSNSSSYNLTSANILSLIAKKFGITVSALESANNLSSTSPTVTIGETLTIPAGGKSGGTTYTVVAGDTLSKIAKKYGVTVAALESYNKLTSTSIQAEEVLKIPPAGTGEAKYDPTFPPFTGTLPLTVGYVQLDGEHGVNEKTLPKEGIACCSHIVLAFASVGPNASGRSYNNETTYLANNAPAETKFFLSVGGATADSSYFTKENVPIIVESVSSQAAGFTGIDLDLENDIDAEVIQGFIEGFKKKGFEVSIAPQLVSYDGNAIDPSNPGVNLGMANSLNAKQFNDAIRNCAPGCKPDYIFLQCYNTPVPVLIDGKQDNNAEQNPKILTSMYNALNTLLDTEYDEKTAPCAMGKLPNVKVAIGFPCNGGAGNANTIYKPNMNAINIPVVIKDGNVTSPSYNQSEVLTELYDQVSSFQWDKNVQGIMTWSLNNDYMPKWYQDNFAVRGLFCQTMFGATAVTKEADVPYMTLSISFGTTPDIAAEGGGIIVTLITKQPLTLSGNLNPFTTTQYNVFGYPLPDNKGVRPLSMTDEPAKFCSITPIANGDVIITKDTPSITESGTLDEIACDTSDLQFDCTVMVSYYKKGQDLNTPADQLIQSQPMPLKIYAFGDNVLSIAIKNLDDSELGLCSTDENPDKNGIIAYSYNMSKQWGSTGSVMSANQTFWWQRNVPSSPPAWLIGACEALFAMTADATLESFVCEVGSKLIKVGLGALGTSFEKEIEWCSADNKKDGGD